MRDSDWAKWLADKPPAFWLTFVGAFLYIAASDAERAPWRVRITKVMAAALLGLGLSDSVAAMFGVSPTLAMAGIIVLGQIVLDAVSALIKDRAELAAMIAALRGRK